MRKTVKKLIILFALMLTICCTALLFACEKSFTVTFDANGGSEVPSQMLVQGKTIEEPHTEREGYEFGGWFVDIDAWNFEKGINANLTLVAKWIPISYDITYVDRLNATNNNPTSYNIESDFTLSNLSKNGYVFGGWVNSENQKVEKIEKGSAGAITLTAVWTTVEYNITYVDELNADNPNPTTYTVESELELLPLTKSGYEFLGWFIDADAWNLETDVIGDITFVAHWRIINYDITYVDVLGAENNNPASYTVESEFSISKLYKDGYAFIGWYDADGNKVERIQKGTMGAITLTAEWRENEFEIDYYNTMDATNLNPLSYKTVGEDISLIGLEKDGYEFVGWIDFQTKEQVSVIPSGSSGNKRFVAVWSPIEYDITYVDSFGVENNNPTLYTIESEFAISDLSKDGYIFNGWINEDEQKVTAIEKGSIGAITLTASWSPEEYAITYIDELNVENTNATTYNIETSVTIYSLSAEGYEFLGWFDGKGYLINEIAEGNFGEITLTAYWRAIEYHIEYMDTFGATNPNPTVYKVNDADIVLADLSRNGYSFNGWYKDNQRIEVIPSGSTGAIMLSASWSSIQYVITYIDELAAVNDNPTSYNIYSDFTISDLEKGGYTFLGWFDEDGQKVVAIESGNTGELTLTAQWEETVYTITYENVCGAEHSNPETYKISSDSITLSDLTREGYDFLGWYDEEGEVIETIESGNTGDLVIRAKWSPVEYYVSFRPKAAIDNGKATFGSLNYTLEGDVAKEDFIVERGGTVSLPDAKVGASYDCVFTYWFVYVNGEISVITPDTPFDYTTVGEDANVVIIPLLTNLNTINF